jgi:hypothetical protein
MNAWQRRPTLLCQYANAYEKSLGGELNLGHWGGGGGIGKLFSTSNCTNSSRKKRLIRVLKFVSKIR